ncbi:MAG: cache domain-containing protein [Elusimicrobiota bacterium]|jgi:HAMP domain-containing protein
MRSHSIKFKILSTIVATFAVGAAILLAALRQSYNHNMNVLAQDSLRNAEKLFSVLRENNIAKMAAASESLMTNPLIQSAMAQQDRAQLMAVTRPLFETLKNQYNITNWIFILPEPAKTVFLRLQNPTRFGDLLGRLSFEACVKTHKPVTGNELGLSGFVVRNVMPFRDSRGKLIGYTEMGEEIGHFLRQMKLQTGDDYGIVLKKTFLNRKDYAATRQYLQQPDNWDDHRDVVIIDKTFEDSSVLRFSGDLDSVPDGGRVLERLKKGNSLFVRGVFPLYDDPTRQKIGGLFVLRDAKDVASTYYSFRQMEQRLLVVILVIIVIIPLLIMILLRRLIFNRIDHIVQVATKVVGGDFAAQVTMSSDDEIGELESLFEQLRAIFFYVLTLLDKAQRK